jgi:hypothetical protein
MSETRFFILNSVLIYEQINAHKKHAIIYPHLIHNQEYALMHY